MNKNNKYLRVHESERLRYRPFTMDDLEAWQPFFENNDRLHFLGLDNSKSPEELARFAITRQLERYITDGFGMLAVERKDNGKLIGMVGIIEREIDGRIEHEVGYSFLKSQWGNGYATEGAKFMKFLATDVFHFNRVISMIHPDNHDSKKVAIRNGMTCWFETNYEGIPLEVFGWSSAQ